MQRCITRTSAWLAFALAIIVISLTTTKSRSPLVRTILSPQFNPEEFNLSDFPAGEKTNLAFDIINPNSIPIRIVGMGGICGVGGCVETVDFRPFELAARQRRTVNVEFRSRIESGPIEASVPVYFSSDRMRSTAIHLRGNLVLQMPDIR